MPDMPLANPPGSGTPAPTDAGLLSRARVQLAGALELIKRAVPQLDLQSDEGKSAVAALKALSNLDLSGTQGLGASEYQAMRPMADMGENVPAPPQAPPGGQMPLPPMMGQSPQF